MKKFDNRFVAYLLACLVVVLQQTINRQLASHTGETLSGICRNDDDDDDGSQEKKCVCV